MDDVENGEEEIITSLANPEITDKYKIAATIANSALAFVAAQCVPGASVLALCQGGDDYIRAECAKVCQKQKNILKGVSFPTSISLNNTAANFSPLKGDPEVLIKEGDIVKMYAYSCHCVSL